MHSLIELVGVLLLHMLLERGEDGEGNATDVAFVLMFLPGAVRFHMPSQFGRLKDKFEDKDPKIFINGQCQTKSKPPSRDLEKTPSLLLDAK